MATTRYCALFALVLLAILAGCGGGSTEDRDVNGTELALGPIQTSSQQISADQIVELSAYAQVGTARGGSLSFPERPLLWHASAGTLSLDRDELQEQSPGDWTDKSEVSAAVGQRVYWRAPQQKGNFNLTVQMADLSQQRQLSVINSLDRMVIETPTTYYALGQINVPPTSVKVNQVIELTADAEAKLFGLPATPGSEEYRRSWGSSAGRLAESSAALTGLGPGPDLSAPSELNTRNAKVFYRTPPVPGVYFVTLDFHRMQQEALIFVVAGP